MSNENWYNMQANAADGWGTSSCELGPSGAFDRLLRGCATGGGFNAAAATSGQFATSDATLELVLQTPCRMSLNSFGLTAMWAPSQCCRTPENMEVYGSTDGSTWTLLGEYDNQFEWQDLESRVFHTHNVDSTDLYDWFKFAIKRVTSLTSGDVADFSELELYTRNLVDLCNDGTSNCDVNAACANAAGSFTCTCNKGFSGDGVTCAPLTQIPPADIGQGHDWTKDDSVTFGGIYTTYRDYRGSVCPGRYRAMANR
uniref:EGF-like domain-containing protein n=1 Tax=Chromera velia CCMP2878 TaxID=1169474 RepID=A0A0G4IBZ1_9ALVE|eukprot:Cvel_2248.t1-p1 / transcript=Cvel_2248.t1 / gene=Cvel_2248 / organism=Chromera_velia_CCMP2878 / gene_product=hypothetical protein / transcript_product=hypothetical protein / location=Cvel_scaffold86:129687-130949(+) / protein_length=255 / sequence_SO=supercontig / SO=protein_coding / is_pseudo=false